MAENDDPVEALAPHGPDPALGVRPRLRRPHRRLDDTDAFRAEDLVELAAELAVAIANEKLRLDAIIIELHQQVARLLGYPAAVRVGGDPGEAHAAGRELDEEQDVEALQEQGIDAEEIALEDARRLLSEEPGPARLQTPRCWLDSLVLQDRPHRARRKLDTEPDQLALDPPVAPTRILARKPRHQLPDLHPGRRPAGAPVRIPPAACHQLAVPAQQRPRRHKRRSPPRLPRQHPAERRQQRPISLRQLWPSDLPLEHAELVAQQKDLDLLLPLRTTPQHT